MASQDSTQDAVTKAIKIVSLKYPEDYSKASTSQINHIREAAEKKVNDLVTLVNNVKTKSIKSWEAFGHLDDQHVCRIRDSLKMKTFKLEIKRENDEHCVYTTSTKGSQFRSPITLSSKADVEESSTLQMASVVVECVIFILELIGIGIPDNENETRKAIGIAIEALGEESTSLIDDVEKLKEANEKGDQFGVAKGILSLVIDVYEGGFFWDMVKALLSGMAWYDWILTSVKIAAFIAMLVATEGLAEIAELVSLLIDNVFFIEKLNNLGTLTKLM